MNWITKIIKAGEKIKTAIHKRASKEDIANSDWTSCCRGPILKKDLEKNLWVCPDCNKHHRITPKNRFDILILGLTTILSDVALWGALSVLTITISKSIFQKGSWGYGLMDGLYGIGALFSVMIVGNLLKNLGRKYYLMICYVIAGLMCFISPIMPNIYLAALAYFFMGINNNAARIIIRTIFMENIPNQIMGRVQTIFGVYTRAMVVLSSLCAGWFIEFNSMSFAIYFTTTHFLIAFFGIIIVSLVWNNRNKKIF